MLKRLRSLDVREDDNSKGSMPKSQDIVDIVEWLHCFATYIALISHMEPHRVADLLGYQSLIIQGYCKYQKGCWESFYI